MCTAVSPLEGGLILCPCSPAGGRQRAGGGRGRKFGELSPGSCLQAHRCTTAFLSGPDGASQGLPEAGMGVEVHSS